jgi:hypothetical protein
MGRKQSVVLNEQASEWGEVVLFTEAVLVHACVFINNINLAMDALRFIVKFADDSKAGRVVDTKEDQEMLDRLEKWPLFWQYICFGHYFLPFAYFEKPFHY